MRMKKAPSFLRGRHWPSVASDPIGSWKKCLRDCVCRVETGPMSKQSTPAQAAKCVDTKRAEEREIAAYLLQTYGPLLGREALVKVLGFPSGEAFDRYTQRGHLALELARLPNRRGVFASASKVAKYLVQISQGAMKPREK